MNTTSRTIITRALFVTTIAALELLGAAPAAAREEKEAKLMEPGLLLQSWVTAAGVGELDTAFRIRRAEIHLKGEVIPDRWRYALMIDPAKVLEFQSTTVAVEGSTEDASVTVRQPVSAVSAFQDFFITYVTPWAEVSLGQFKIPVSWEGFNSSSKLLFPERALVSRLYGDKRDLGLRVGKKLERFGYWAGLFNGAGLNNPDTNDGKDGTLRLEVYPIDGLLVGGVVYASLWDRDDRGSKDRYEADLRFERGPFLFQSELIRARDVAGGGRATHAQGFYAALAYRVLEVVQPALRVGYVDPNLRRDVDPSTSGGSDEVWQLDAGLNYYIEDHGVKLQLSGTRFEYDDQRARHEVILATQLAF